MEHERFMHIDAVPPDPRQSLAVPQSPQ